MTDGPRRDPDLGGAAFEGPAPAPREAFRTDLRARFVSGALDAEGARAGSVEFASREGGAARTGSHMVHRPDDPADAAGVARSEAPGARTRFRRTLRSQFTSGAILGDPELTPRHVGRQGSGARGRSAPQEPPRGLIHPMVRPLLVAAGVALMSFVGYRLWGGDGAVAWDVTHVARGEQITVDGADLGATQLADLSTTLAAADVVSFGESEVELALDEGVDVAILPGTVLERMPFQAREAGAPLELHLAQGEVFVRTEEGTGPHDIRIHTEHAEVRVVGTTLGVMCMGPETCVCVAEGMVKVMLGDDRSREVMVPARQSLVLIDGEERDMVKHFEPGVDPAMEAHFVDLKRFFELGTRVR